MNSTTISIAKTAAIFLILTAAVMGSLVVFDALSMDTFTESLTKIGGVALIVVAATAVIGLITGGDSKNDKK